MAEAVTAAPAANAVAAPTTAQPAADTTVYAGKYQGVESLEKGVRELYKSQGLAVLPEGSLIGDGKVFKTPQEMEAAYRKAESLVGRPKEPATPKPDTAMFPKEPEKAPEPTEDVDIAKVLDKAGFTQAEIYKLYKADSLTDGVLDKLRENHPEYSKLSRKTGNKAVRDGIVAEMGRVVEQEKKAADVVGGIDNLAKLGANWTEYVPPERQQSLATLMNNPATYVEAALLLKQYHEAKHGSGATGPKPVSGGVASPMGQDEIKKAREAAFSRIVSGKGTADDYATFKKKVQ